jgi:tetratricopeptide (TPR) repeat protein
MRGSVWVNLGRDLLEQGRDPRDAYAKACADFGETLKRHPGWPPFWVKRGLLRNNWALAAPRFGEDAEPHFREAIGDLDEAVRVDPTPAYEARLMRAEVLMQWGRHRADRDTSPDDRFERALQDLGVILDGDPGHAEALEKRGFVRMNRALWIEREGDPSDEYRSAIETFTAAIEADARRPEPWVGRGMAQTNEGTWRFRHRRSPVERYEQACRDLEEALKRDPRSEDALSGLATTRMNWAMWEEATDPVSDNLREKLGFCQVKAGDARQAAGENPSPWYARGEEALTEAIRRDPAPEQRWRMRGSARMSWAHYEPERGHELLRLAAEDFGEAIRRISDDPRVWTNRGNCRLTLAALLEGRGEGAEEHRRAGFEDLDRAASLAPSMGEPWMVRAVFQMNRAKRARGEAARPHYEAALNDLLEAVRRDPSKAREAEPMIRECKAALGR